MDENRLVSMESFIDKKINKSKLFDKYTAILTGSNDDIVNTMNDAMRNLVLSFFKGGLFKEKKCDHCNTTDKSLQYERAHSKDFDRKKVGLNAINRIRKNETESISAKTFLKAFIEEHKYSTIYYLCKPCHKIYDTK